MGNSSSNGKSKPHIPGTNTSERESGTGAGPQDQLLRLTPLTSKRLSEGITDIARASPSQQSKVPRAIPRSPHPIQVSLRDRGLDASDDDVVQALQQYPTILGALTHLIETGKAKPRTNLSSPLVHPEGPPKHFIDSTQAAQDNNQSTLDQVGNNNRFPISQSSTKPKRPREEEALGEKLILNSTPSSSPHHVQHPPPAKRHSSASERNTLHTPSALSRVRDATSSNDNLRKINGIGQNSVPGTHQLERRNSSSSSPQPSLPKSDTTDMVVCQPGSSSEFLEQTLPFANFQEPPGNLILSEIEGTIMETVKVWSTLGDQEREQAVSRLIDNLKLPSLTTPARLERLKRNLAVLVRCMMGELATMQTSRQGCGTFLLGDLIRMVRTKWHDQSRQIEGAHQELYCKGNVEDDQSQEKQTPPSSSFGSIGGGMGFGFGLGEDPSSFMSLSMGKEMYLSRGGSAGGRESCLDVKGKNNTGNKEFEEAIKKCRASLKCVGAAGHEAQWLASQVDKTKNLMWELKRTCKLRWEEGLDKSNKLKKKLEGAKVILETVTAEVLQRHASNAQSPEDALRSFLESVEAPSEIGAINILEKRKQAADTCRALGSELSESNDEVVLMTHAYKIGVLLCDELGGNLCDVVSELRERTHSRKAESERALQAGVIAAAGEMLKTLEFHAKKKAAAEAKLERSIKEQEEDRKYFGDAASSSNSILVQNQIREMAEFVETSVNEISHIVDVVQALQERMERVLTAEMFATVKKDVNGFILSNQDAAVANVWRSVGHKKQTPAGSKSSSSRSDCSVM